ncbi:helix-turn-helix domain-containing protein [Streptomyces sp. BE308]|uniref:helix-turn-helix transcriptional regulator n=1 Tax=unclassified Streptomyces TaxID=2593676 RepID=UPI002DDB7691|nr:MULTISPECIES: helix-turn-helix domain-containing protein [unclassified Streptomyces]MEE1789341.1 helix-turn-helix domain-containing protein [Streptomyces sp. BE308]WRZ73379.1 helix-turn-helix domain-containing protein [Streptomyces sp. NBC_01237]
MADTGIGLDARSELLYRKLLLRATWRTHELAQALAWSADQVMRALDGLRTEGLASASGEDGAAFRAVEPCIALPALLAWRMREGRSPQPCPIQIGRFIALHEQAERFGDPVGGGESRHDVSVTIERLVAKVEREVVFLVPQHSEGGFEFSRPIVDMVLRRGARFRSVWASSVLQSPGAMAHAQWLTQEGAALRSVGTVPPRAMIMDGAVAVVIDETEGARVVRSAAELERLCALAERFWERGATVRQTGRQPGATTRRPRSEVVLRLLSEGLTDDAIARRLGCSVRTVRNDVASAMAALDARSRFQAGARAMQVGLI